MTTLRRIGTWSGRIAWDSPARAALIAFAMVIMVVAGLLSLPAATASGTRVPFIDALFTATSAVCVTGLATVDTAEHWSVVGKVIIAVAMKVGGLGIMTMASLLVLAVSHRLRLAQRRLAAQETKAMGLGDVRALIRTIVMVSLIAEAAIAAALLPRFLALGHDLGTALGYSGFYAVSAFNNAGFVPNPGGTMPFATDAWILTPIAVGVWVGALGFPVFLTMVRGRLQVSTWSLHAKLTVVTATVLTVVSAVMLAAYEWGNSQSLGQYGGADRLSTTVFHAINQRSGGFSTIEVGAMHESTLLFESVLMFIGGGSGSTAGGIRVTTFAVIMLAIVAEARGRRDIEAFGKRIGTEVLRVSVSIVVIGLSTVIVGAGVLMQQTGLPLAPALYEAVSAFATCGLSTGITDQLDADAKTTLIVLMYVGRVGSMTIAAALALSRQRRVIRYPSERPIVG